MAYGTKSPALFAEASNALAEDRVAKDKQDTLRDLLGKHSVYGWTESQAAYVRSLIAPPRACSEEALKGAARIHGMLALAAAKLKKPAIEVQTDDGKSVVFLWHGKTSTVYIKTGRQYGAGLWGRIGPCLTLRLHHSTPADVEMLVEDFGTDAVNVALRHGKKTGLCCFCNRPLKDERSTQHGYGPVCAETFKLPWR